MAGEETYDRPELLPDEQSAVDKQEAQRREDVRRELERDDKRWLKRTLANPSGRRFLWNILAAAGTFEERYGFGPNGFPNQEATWSYRGQTDFGLRLYHTWSTLDREGVLSLLDEFHPQFPKPRKGK